MFRSDVERKALLRRRRARSVAGRGLSRRSIRKNLSQPDRQGRARRARRLFGHRRRGLRQSREERAAIEAAAAAGTRDFRGLFLVADLPTRLQRVGGARARRVGCRRRGGAPARRVRYRRGRLDHRRCIRLARSKRSPKPARAMATKIRRHGTSTAAPCSLPIAQIRQRFVGADERIRHGLRHDAGLAARWRRTLRRPCA